MANKVPKPPLETDVMFQRNRYRAGSTEYPDELAGLRFIEAHNARVNGLEELTARLGAERAEQLQAAGFLNQAAVDAATDATLMEVKGIGKATVGKLRTQKAAPAAEDTASDAEGV